MACCCSSHISRPWVAQQEPGVCLQGLQQEGEMVSPLDGTIHVRLVSGIGHVRSHSPSKQQLQDVLAEHSVETIPQSGEEHTVWVAHECSVSSCSATFGHELHWGMCSCSFGSKPGWRTLLLPLPYDTAPWTTNSKHVKGNVPYNKQCVDCLKSCKTFGKQLNICLYSFTHMAHCLPARKVFSTVPFPMP